MKQKIGAFSAVLLMCAAVACTAPAGNNNDSAAQESIAAEFPIAYVNSDSIMNNFVVAKEKIAELQSKQEDARVQLSQKANAFQQEAVNFERKVQNNAFSDLKRAQSEQQRIQKMQQDLQVLDQKLSNDLAQAQAKLSEELRKIVLDYIAEISEGRYSLVLSNSMVNDNVYYAAKGVDITDEVVAGLNAKYSKE